MTLAWIKIRDGYYKFTEVEKEKVKHYNFTCKKCKSKNDYWAEKNCFPYKCLICKDTGIKPENGSFYKKEIPSWRLHLDDATFEDILTKKPEEFGAPYMSEQDWKRFYSQEREVKKLREYEEARTKLLKEGIAQLVREKNEE